ncbi:MAG: NUDIX domain-containing protein [Nanoarchaeota archaeon]|nr:NUDIX domain-containing protein [Nanoarchaeota archaeon]
MVREISAGAVIFRRENGKPIYLLLHYGSGHWDFVKGHIEKGEDEITTVKRETYEETGITDLKIIPGFRERIRYFFRRGKEVVYKEVIFYLAETKQEKVKLSYEHVGYIWLPYEDALRQLTFENAKNVLRKAHAHINKL